MSSPLSEVDRELLGEVPVNNGADSTMAEAHGGPDHSDLNDSSGAQFNPLNAIGGTLVQADSNGDDLEAGNGNQDANMETTKPAPKTPKKRGAAAAANDDSSQPSKKRSPTKKATVTTNTNGEGTEPITTSKKRALPKKKNAADAKVKTESGETDGETEGPEPVTPKKGKRTTGKGKGTKADSDSKANDETTETTDKSVSPTKGKGEIEGTTVHNTPRKRQAPKKELAAPRGIPDSWENADDADRMLVMMKAKGDGWNEIRAAWKTVTGQDTASSTLPNRYNRIKVNMLRLKEGDDQHLLLAKKDIEGAYNTNFWANVAANMERRGASKYPTAFLQKTFKELEAAGKAVIDPATNRTTATDDAATNEANEDDAIKEEDSAGEGDAA